MMMKAVIRNWQYLLLASGLSLCLLGALLMVIGEGILGENHGSIAAVIGIVGIGVIGTFNETKKLRTAKETRKETRIVG